MAEDSKKKYRKPKTKKSKAKDEPKAEKKVDEKKVEVEKPHPSILFDRVPDDDIKVTVVDKKMSKPDAPQGLGLYIRAMPNSKGKIYQRVKHMADHGIKWAAIGACWQDQDRKTKAPTLRVMNHAARVHLIIKAMLTYGIVPYLWGYPWRGREQQFVEIMAAASTPDVRGWLIDPELGMKRNKRDLEHDTMEEVLAAAKALFWACVDHNPYKSIAFTSYGFVKGHPTFPWEGFAEKGGFDPLKECDFGSPQLYDEDQNDILRGLTQYRDIGVDVIVPSFGTYRFDRDDDGNRIYPRMNYAELKAHFQSFLNLKDEFNIQAMIGWSEMQIRSDAWRAIAETAALFG
jgi:hypothetical protein